jgi:hypothetical protein
MEEKNKPAQLISKNFNEYLVMYKYNLATFDSLYNTNEKVSHFINRCSWFLLDANSNFCVWK